MKILESKQVAVEWDDLDEWRRQPDPDEHERSSGVHVSGILKAVALDLNLLQNKQVDTEDLDEFPLRMMLGLAWEHYMAGFYPGMHWQPGELERDRIFGSPDGESWLDEYEDLCIDEFKFTYKSIRRRNLLNEWMWIHQVRAYCAMHPARPTLGRFHVCWSCGDYSYPHVPVYGRYVVQFTAEEVESTWTMMQSNRELAVEEVH